MNVAWALFWGGSRGTKPCVFPCKVASAGDQRYLVCAALQPFVPGRPSVGQRKKQLLTLDCVNLLDR